MQKKDMQVGSMYAWMRSKYGSPRAVIVLDVDRIWTDDRRSQRYRVSTATKPSRSGSWRVHGWLVLTGDSDVLRGVEPPVDLTDDTIDALQDSLPENVYLDVVNNRNLIGVWSVVMAQREAEDIERRRDAQKAAERWERLDIEFESIIERTQARGISVERTSFRRDEIKISFADLVALLDAADAAKD